MLTIRSMSSDRELIFSPCDERDRYCVEIKSSEISVSVEIHQYKVGESLAAYFRHLASFRDPWSDPQEWITWTPNLRISTTCNKYGHVLFRIIFAANFMVYQIEEGWEANIGLATTLGELDNIANNATTFFNE